METLLQKLRPKRWVNLFIVNLRILLGFAFLPAGLKKVLDQPFTDPENTGTFHEFLHAFHATGFFYQFVGAVQLAIAVLLMTQTFATLGALMAVPVFATISVFCWSTSAFFTAAMATLMLFGSVTLVAWDYEKWRGVVPGQEPAVPATPQAGRAVPPLDPTLWRRCGSAILVLYLGISAYSGGIYRPKGVELHNPAFYILPLIALFPLVTLAIEHVRRRRPDHQR
ncbi:MAG TPA: hypothetical protein VML75_10395 [Kofleriaceae bacterium]|nr:hypothetical protein [Kofleriaceae bacterium]